MNKSKVNQIYLLLDASGSMSKHANKVVKMFDEQIKHWEKRSTELNQETRISTYIFSDNVDCVHFDIDVARKPSIKGKYKIQNMTNLVGATLKAIEDGRTISTIYRDVSHLVLVISDGKNNVNQHLTDTLNSTIKNLDDSWTVAISVPNQTCVYDAKQCGFPVNNIQVWDVDSEDGYEEMSNTIIRATDSYMKGRSTGMRSTTSLFNLDATNLKTTDVKKNLIELKAKEYELLPVHKDAVIADFVKSWMKEYRVGSAYYQITKAEKIQAYKQILIQDKANGKVYGGTEARDLLSLPNYEIKVNPVNYGKYDIFLQSTSANRKLLKGTKLIVLK